MGIDIEYLKTFLDDELRDLTDIRIYIVLPSSTRKSPDLPQDYDPNAGQIHLKRGVNVRVRGRIYFFPATWSDPSQRSKLESLIEEIRRFHV